MEARIICNLNFLGKKCNGLCINETGINYNNDNNNNNNTNNNNNNNNDNNNNNNNNNDNYNNNNKTLIPLKEREKASLRAFSHPPPLLVKKYQII